MRTDFSGGRNIGLNYGWKMTTSKLTLYDLIVDLTPGVAALLLFTWILLPDRLPELVDNYGVALPAIVLLTFGYIAGRIIHGISSLDRLENGIVKFYNWRGDQIEAFDREFSNRLAKLLEKEDSESLEVQTARKAWNQINEGDESWEELEFDEDPSDPDAFDTGSIGEIHDLRYAQYLADSMTYRGQNLSWKYGILSTFFRNMWVILFAGVVLYVITVVARLYLQNQLPDPFVAGSVIVLLSIFSLICIQQQFKFKRRQIRTMINELAIQAPE